MLSSSMTPFVAEIFRPTPCIFTSPLCKINRSPSRSPYSSDESSPRQEGYPDPIDPAAGSIPAPPRQATRQHESMEEFRS